MQEEHENASAVVFSTSVGFVEKICSHCNCRRFSSSCYGIYYQARRYRCLHGQKASQLIHHPVMHMTMSAPQPFACSFDCFRLKEGTRNMGHLAVHQDHCARYPDSFTVYNLWIGATKTDIEVGIQHTLFFWWGYINVKSRSLW